MFHPLWSIQKLQYLFTKEFRRFGMEEDDFRDLAVLIHDLVKNNKNVTDEAMALRERFSELKFCFRGNEYAELLQKLHELL